ncbi:HAMP domain-containing protein [Mycolicibacterium sp. P1-18]|uniref:sensor histidine kinase n=1 Tax=Mycolicibacterium sp. P1-18 TaxID=2024615 RepID=UPI0011F3333C|nr:sensor histidine kinase [Mycolicibacterium sp. P1-18]KAA0092679.1 HAMP domain-containing protein [Mycolicibacterium sp. P1-18]
MTTTTDEAPRRSSPLTVQGWQTLVLTIMGLLVLGAGIAGGLLLNRYDEVAHELIDDIQPSRSAAYQLQAALRDQETATRGYAISADPQFLTPYYAGQQAQAAAAQQLRERAGDRTDLIADVDAVDRAAASWRTSFAEPLIATVRPGAPAVVDPAVAERGKTEFDQIRALFDTQNAHLAEARTDGIEDLDRIRWWRNAVLSAIVVVLLVTAAALAIVMQTAVTRPLASLAASCRRITEGHFGQRIVPQGPKDIRSIAVDVENMRQRIVDELEASRTAEAQLDEQAVELRRSNAELEQFAYVASHDLQEPLRKVTSFCQLLEKRYRDKLDDRGVEYIDFAVDGAKRMQVLINDLLTFSRVGRLNAARTDVDLDAALDDGLANLAVAIEETAAEILRPAEPLPQVVGDPTLLAMLWQNLIGNAMKFHREGVAPRIAIDWERTTDPADSAEPHYSFTLSDNGIGIAPEFVDKVFVIFQRLHGRDSYGGTGIGLALCKKIVEHHGGAIWIDTSYTDGTRFRFTLPVPTPTHAPAPSLEGTAP